MKLPETAEVCADIGDGASGLAAVGGAADLDSGVVGTVVGVVGIGGVVFLADPKTSGKGNSEGWPDLGEAVDTAVAESREVFCGEVGGWVNAIDMGGLRWGTTEKIKHFTSLLPQ